MRHDPIAVFIYYAIKRSTVLLYFVLLNIFLLFFENKAYSQDLQINPSEQPSFVTSFRLGHELQVLLSVERNNWIISQTTPPVDISERVADVNSTHTAGGLFLRYQYNTPLFANFGFFVGSTFGFVIDYTYYGTERNFTPGVGYFFPSVLGGLEQNISSRLRIFSGIEYSIAWYPRMAVYTNDRTKKVISAVPNVISISAGLDFNFSQAVTVMISAGVRRIKNPCLASCDSSTYVNTLRIENRVLYGQVGMSISDLD